MCLDLIRKSCCHSLKKFLSNDNFVAMSGENTIWSNTLKICYRQIFLRSNDFKSLYSHFYQIFRLSIYLKRIGKTFFLFFPFDHFSKSALSSKKCLTFSKIMFLKKYSPSKLLTILIAWKSDRNLLDRLAILSCI